LIEGEQTGENLVAETVRPAITPRVFALAGSAVFGFLLFIVKDELAGRFEIGPSLVLLCQS
jgi:hypothetical protein